MLHTNTQTHKHTNTHRRHYIGFGFFVLIWMLGFYSCIQDDSKTTRAIGEDTQNVSVRVSGLFGTSCGPELLGMCNNATVIPDNTHLTNVAGYPGCSFDISFEYVLCNTGGGNNVFYIGNYVITDHNCSQFDIDLENAKLQGDVALNTFVAAFDTKIHLGINRKLLELLPASQKFCSPFKVPSVQFNYVSPACYTICLSILKETHSTFNKYSCGTGCCKVSNFVCIDPVTNELVVIPNGSTSYGQNNCAYVNTPTTPIRGCYYMTVCNFSCQQ